MWEIDRRLQEDQARPMVYHLRFATCWQRKVKGLRMIVNSVFNGWRFEDVWLDEKSVPRALYAACTIGPTCGNLPRIIALHQSPTRVGNDVATCVSRPASWNRRQIACSGIFACSRQLVRCRWH